MMNGRLMHSVVLFLLLILSSCSQLLTADKPLNAKKSYQPKKIPSQWELKENKNVDYILHGPQGSSILMQSFCNEFQGSPLNSLADKTFNSLDKSKITTRTEFILQERAALKTTGEAYIDGKQIYLTLINTKRNHCYYDFLEILPLKHSPSVIDEVINGVKFK